MSTTRWNKAMRLPYSEGGTTICEKHDFAYDNYMDSEMAWEVAEALRQAKDDGQRMEKRLQELGEDANNLEECLKDAENERDSAFAEIARLRAIPDLIRKRYPRMLERGNPLYDGVLADLLESSTATATEGSPSSGRGCPGTGGRCRARRRRSRRVGRGLADHRVTDPAILRE